MSVTIKVLCQNRRRTAEPFEYRPGYVFNTDPDCRTYDWLVAYDELHVDHEDLACPRERTILLTGEPTSIKSYSKAYTRQFGHLLTNRPYEAEKHPHYHLGRGYYYWFHGRNYEESLKPVTALKNRIVSACISNKQMCHTQHRLRFALATALSRSVSGFDWYGRGVRTFGRKYDVLDPYRYHVAIENHIAPHHWSEKIADAFLCECLPFYAGDPLLTEVFPQESFIPIPIDDPDEAARIIRSAIAEDAYARRREAVLEAKRRILEKYNFWAQVISVVDESSAQKIRVGTGPVVIRSRRNLRWHSPQALAEDIVAGVRRFAGGIRHA